MEWGTGCKARAALLLLACNVMPQKCQCIIVAAGLSGGQCMYSKGGRAEQWCLALLNTHLRETIPELSTKSVAAGTTSASVSAATGNGIEDLPAIARAASVFSLEKYESYGGQQ